VMVIDSFKCDHQMTMITSGELIATSEKVLRSEKAHYLETRSLQGVYPPKANFYVEIVLALCESKHALAGVVL